MTGKILILPPDCIGEGDREAIENAHAAVHRRDAALAPDRYYEILLETLSKEKARCDSLKILLWEDGESLGEEEPAAKDALYLLSDVNGLLFQPSCRTVDEAGGIRFVDAAKLFNPGWIRQAEQVLQNAGFQIQVGLGAAVAAPRLLTPAEKAVLRGWGAEVAVKHLYLEARAARACGLTALGIAAPRSLESASRRKALSILSAME